MYLLVIVTVIELEAIVALYNKSLEAISYPCFEHVQCTVYSSQKRLQTSAKPSIQYPDPLELWAYQRRAKFPFHSG